MAKVLFIVSGATYWVLKDGTRYATGYWAEEFANPYKELTDAGHEVVVATPGGVTPNVDMMSLRPSMAGGAPRRHGQRAADRVHPGQRVDRQPPGERGALRVRRVAGDPFVCRPFADHTSRTHSPGEDDMTAFDAFRYDGKRVLVVGAASGMGAATAALVATEHEDRASRSAAISNWRWPTCMCAISAMTTPSRCCRCF